MITVVICIYNSASSLGKTMKFEADFGSARPQMGDSYWVSCSGTFPSHSSAPCALGSVL